MAPLLIDIMLHHYTSYAPFHRPSPAADEMYNGLCDPGREGGGPLLVKIHEPADGLAGYALTDRGKAYCEALLRVQFPIQKWVAP